MSFTVTIQSSGHQFACGERQSVLAAGLDAGYMLPYNCRSGFCRTCKSRIVSGKISYADRPMTHYLSEAEQAAGYALLCQASPRSDILVDAAEIVGVENIAPRRTPCRITELTQLAADVMLVRLRLPLNENVRYFAGQHLKFYLGDGIEREYSIANACQSAGMTEFELHVRRLEGGVFTDRLFTQMSVRALMRIEVPLGTFFLRSDSVRPVILMATGTGFAPIKAMVEHAIATGDIERRAFTLYWGARRSADLYMAEQTRRWAEEHDAFRFIPVLSRPADDGNWTGPTGYVQDRVLEDYPDLSGADVYACGSPAMIEDAEARFAALGTRAPAAFFADEFLTAAERAVRQLKVLEEGRP